jgi:uncharacterized membrane protein YphA (DoxX/SURF4 family)
VVAQIIIPAAVAALTLVYTFRKRHEPEPPNNALKLPFAVVGLAVCIVAIAVGFWTILFAICAAVLVVQIVFIARGRNPWWMQAVIDRQKQPRQPTDIR